MIDGGFGSERMQSRAWQHGWMEVWVRGPDSPLSLPPVAGLAARHPDLHRRMYEQCAGPEIQRGDEMCVGIIELDSLRRDVRTFIEDRKDSRNKPGKILTQARKRLFEELESGLRALAANIKANPHTDLARAQYFVGRTRLGSPSAAREERARERGVPATRIERMGFEVYPFEGPFAETRISESHDMAWQSFTDAGMKPDDAADRAHRRGERLVVMSRDILLERYGSQPKGGGDAHQAEKK